MRSVAIALLLVAVFAAASDVQAQAYIGYMPAAPAVAYYAPPVTAYAPVVQAAPVVTTAFYAPQTVYYAAPAPYFVAAPIAIRAAPAAVAVAPVYGRAVIVRPKVYVVGQPVRNVLRAVTP